LIINGHEVTANGCNCSARALGSVVYLQTYNAENRIASIQRLASGGTCSTVDPALADKWGFAYDGDGTRVSQLHTPYTNGQPQTPEMTRYYSG